MIGWSRVGPANALLKKSGAFAWLQLDGSGPSGCCYLFAVLSVLTWDESIQKLNVERPKRPTGELFIIKAQYVSYDLLRGPLVSLIGLSCYVMWWGPVWIKYISIHYKLSALTKPYNFTQCRNILKFITENTNRNVHIHFYICVCVFIASYEI